MQLKNLLLYALLFISLLVKAQNKHQDSGYIIYTLAKDTIEITHYRLTGDDFTTTIVQRANSNVNKLKGRFFPNGELQYMEGYRYKPVIGKDSLLLLTFRLYQKGDSTYIEEKSGDKITEKKYAGRAMVSYWPYVHMSVILANYVPKNVGDSIVGNHFGDPPAKFVVKRISDRKLTANSRYMGPFTLYLNERGKVDSIDAIGSSYNVKGTIVPHLNLDSVILLYAKREQQFGPFGWPNKSDSVQTDIGNTNIKINYSRPSMRGRVIFGEVVPWNRYWRTGANQATKITINHPLNFNGKILPAGEYSVFTMPSQVGWTIMFNKEANIWGTNYNPAYDILRVPMQAELLREPVELMTIEVVPTAMGGTINVIWERIEASAHFTTSQ
ncbi:MAG: DUF2911 domain-containing protein [Panacibacter sp.]